MRSCLRTPAALLSVGVLAVGLAACSKSSDSSSGSSSSKAPATSASSKPSPMAQIATLTGVDTQVTLDPSTAMALKGLNVTVAPVAPATAKVVGTDTIAAFPITGGNVQIYDKNVNPYITGKVTHTGGLMFSAGGKTLAATNFIVDPGTSMLTATVGGSQVPLLALDGTNVQISKEGANVVLTGTVAKLTKTAADALNMTFGVTAFKEGIPLGKVKLTAAGS